MRVSTRAYGYICGNILKKRIKPVTIQLPITNYCNSKCITCNIWKSKEKGHIDPFLLKKAFEDPFFNKVETVGVNGGEPSLHNKFEDVIDAILILPKLTDIYVISNGVITDLLLKKLENIKSKCYIRKVKLHITISLDGINETHEQVRGIKESFYKTFQTIVQISNNKSRYCDYLDVGYTISKENVTDMIAVKELLGTINVTPYYHIAVPNKRINTFKIANYSVLEDFRATCLAREFFFSEFLAQKNIKVKLKNYINFYYLKNANHKRIATCNYLRRDITIDEQLNVYLCATTSDKVGNLNEASMTEIVKRKQLEKEVSNVENYCKNCIHYAFAPNIKGLFLFTKEIFSKGNLIIDLICARLHF